MLDGYLKQEQIPGNYQGSFKGSLVWAPCLMHRWNKNPTLSQNHNLPTYRPTYLSNFLPTYVLLSYLSGSCTYFLISCFLTTHLTYLLTISLKNHPWKVDSLLSPLTLDGHCSQSLLATRTTCCPSGLKGSFIRHQKRRIQAETIWGGRQVTPSLYLAGEDPVRPWLHSRYHCRYQPSFTICNIYDPKNIQIIDSGI